MAFRGVLCKLNTDRTAVNYSTPAALDWDGADVYDTADAHNPASSNTKIIIPAEWNGEYGVITAQLHLPNVNTVASAAAYLHKNGAVFFEGAASTNLFGSGDAASAGYFNLESAPVLLTTGDEYEVVLYSSDVSIDVDADSCSFGLRVTPGSKPGLNVLCKLSADQTTANYSTPAAIAWDGTDEYDTSAAHDPASSNTKIIIPAAWNGKYAIFMATAACSSVSNHQLSSIGIRRTASVSYIGFAGQSMTTGANGGFLYVTAVSPPIIVSTAEEYEAYLYCADTSITVESENSSFGCWIVD